MGCAPLSQLSRQEPKHGVSKHQILLCCGSCTALWTWDEGQGLHRRLQTSGKKGCCDHEHLLLIISLKAGWLHVVEMPYNWKSLGHSFLGAFLARFQFYFSRHGIEHPVCMAEPTSLWCKKTPLLVACHTHGFWHLSTGGFMPGGLDPTVHAQHSGDCYILHRPKFTRKGAQTFYLPFHLLFYWGFCFHCKAALRCLRPLDNCM